MGNQADKIRVSAGEDLLAFIPHMVGYWPKHSIVCIGMSGKRLRATMRLDLPPDHGPDARHFATVAASQLASDSEADGCLIAIFGRDDWADPENFPQAETFLALRKAFAEEGLPVRDAWYVGDEHWRSLECTDAACCPWPGKNNASIKESFVNTEFIFRGSMVRESPKEQIQERISVKDKAFAAAVVAAGNDVRKPLAEFGSGEKQMAANLGAWDFSLARWPATPDADMAAFLIASLADTTVRDTVIVALASTADHAFTGAAAMGLLEADTNPVLVPRNWYGGSQSAECTVAIEGYSETRYLRACRDFGNILVGEIDDGDSRIVGPDWNRLDRAQPLLEFLAAASSGADKCPVLCVLGWIQWCKGRGTWAGEYFQLCQEFQPGYRLAHLLDQLLAVGHIAACAKDQRTAWHGLREETADDQAA
ncbi:protein of unknown function [Arthrobacter alpinus]|uniref:DUF4192 domain-containing protein n=1 Tax=Arthrobacter alpinus TaxID=656366 RepID=A0A1H5H275_9MICC|nr:DUF4192 domain-containing protein [Arthrobacter alpinus]SEE22072.1 protein of unknown function [Arthrobacter alpinus]